MAREDGFITRKRASKLCLALVSTRSSSAFFWPRCGVWISTLRPRFSESSSSSASRSSKSTGTWIIDGNVLLVEIDLLQQRGEELRLVEFVLVFPEEFAAVHDLAVAQVEQVERHQRRLGVAGEDIDVVALGRGHLLPFFHLFHGRQQVAQRAASSKRISSDACCMRARRPRPGRRGALPETASRSRTAAGIRVVGGEALHARTQAAVNVVLQAGLGMVAREIHLARRHQKMAVDEVHQAMRQVGREVRAVVSGAILAQAARHVDARVFFAGQLDVGVGLVVAQQDIEARLVLLDEVVFERQRLFFVVDQDVVDIARLRRSACRS